MAKAVRAKIPTDTIKKLLAEYNVERTSDLKDEDRNKFAEKVEKLINQKTAK